MNERNNIKFFNVVCHKHQSYIYIYIYLFRNRFGYWLTRCKIYADRAVCLSHNSSMTITIHDLNLPDDHFIFLSSKSYSSVILLIKYSPLFAVFRTWQYVYRRTQQNSYMIVICVVLHLKAYRIESNNRYQFYLPT
jgi:hypothetical protein